MKNETNSVLINITNNNHFDLMLEVCVISDV